MTEADEHDRITDWSLPLIAVIWGANFAVIKVALEELHPLTFNALRFPLAAAFLWVLLRARRSVGRPRRPERSDLLRIVVLGLLGHVVYQQLFIFGVDMTTAGNASLLLASTPAWTLLLSVAVGHERPGPAVWIGVAATVAGIVLVVVGGGEMRRGAGADGAPPADPSGRLRGDLLMLCASLTWALFTVGGRRMVRKYGPLPVTAWTLWIGTPFIVVLGLPGVAGEWPAAPLSGTAWAGVVYAGVLAISVAYLIWYRGVARVGSSRTAVYSNLVPVVALGVAWAWLGEVPAPLQWAGAAVVLAGVTLTRRPPRARRAAPAGDAAGAEPPETRTR